MTPSRPHILLIADVPNWIFHRHTKVLERFLSDEFDFSVLFRGQAYEEDDYDLIYPLEFDMVKPEQILSPQKYVTGIRSHASWADLDFIPFINFLSEKFQCVHVVSRRLWEIFSPFLPGVRYVTHGVDTHFFTPTKSVNQSRNQLRLGWSGNRKNPHKGFDEFICPSGMLPGVELVYCSYADRSLTLEEMPAFYDSIDAYICTSSYEGSNNSLLEASAMERAIITTDNGTVPEYLVDEESALIVPREQTAFISAVERLRDDPDLRARLGGDARRAVVEGGWDWENKAEEYRGFFWSALDDNKDHRLISDFERDRREKYSSRLLEVVHSQWELEREKHLELAARTFKQTEGKDLIVALEDKSEWLEKLEDHRDSLMVELDKKDEWIEEKDKWIGELENLRDSLMVELDKKDKWIEEKDKWIGELENFRDSLMVELEKKDKWIEEQGKLIEEQGKLIEEQGKLIEEQGKSIEELEKFRNDLINSRGYRLLMYLRASRLVRWMMPIWRWIIGLRRWILNVTDHFKKSGPISIREPKKTQSLQSSLASPSAPAQSEFDERERHWIDDFRKDPQTLSVFHPEWLGIRSATRELFDKLYELGDDLDEEKGRHLARIFQEAGVPRLVIQGFPLTYQYLVNALHEIAPETLVYAIWHGGFVQTYEDYGWKSFNLIDQFCRQGYIQKWGFVKKGMAEVVACTGVKTGFVMNMVRAIPSQPSVPLSGGPHLGIWASWRKLPYAMMAAVRMVPHATAHIWGADNRGREFFQFMQLKGDVSTNELPINEVRKKLAQMHVNLYVSLYECAPMLPLESLSVGAPCLLGPHSHYFEDHQYLHSRLVVPAPDRADIIADYLERAIRERNEIVQNYQLYAQDYNQKAKSALQQFLELQ